MHERNIEIRAAVNVLSEHAALIMRTARYSADPDGFGTGNQRAATAAPDSDVDLTLVESHAIRARREEPERTQALAVIEFQRLACALLSRAQEYTLRLRDRVPQEVRDVAAVSCVDCGQWRGDGWDAAHPNGVAGRCRKCYERRRQLRRK
jgi:hypothetical protein